jgi:hypothetical protein
MLLAHQPRRLSPRVAGRISFISVMSAGQVPGVKDLAIGDFFALAASFRETFGGEISQRVRANRESLAS